MNELERIVYLMRGLPSCGKSHRARQLAGPDGVVLETDQYFYTKVGDDPRSYDYDKQLLSEARQWNFDRFQRAISQGVSPIVVDRGNGLNAETRQYAVFAMTRDYRVELAEPNSPWWQELRVLLKYKHYVAPELFNQWAEELAQQSRKTHRVPEETIRHWMTSWRANLTIEEILQCDSTDPIPND